MYETFGIIGGLILSYSNIPQLWLFFKQGHAEGISKSGNWIAAVGIVFKLSYMIHLSGFNWIVISPYIFGIICLIITMFYSHFPRKK